jgi:hypothetical protein
MTHIKQIMDKKLENISKAKFFNYNRDIFLKYFENEVQYNALILAANFDKIREIIKSKKEQ